MRTSAQRQLAKTVFLLAAVLWAFSPVAATAYLFDSSDAVSSAHLDTMRGGFITGNGLKISLGIEKAVMIGGVLQTLNTLNIPDLADPNGVPQSIASTPSPQDSPAVQPIAVANTGLNPATGTLVFNDGYNTVIQNSLDQETIQNLTIVNATVSNVDLYREMQLMTRINEQLINALH